MPTIDADEFIEVSADTDQVYVTSRASTPPGGLTDSHKRDLLQEAARSFLASEACGHGVKQALEVAITALAAEGYACIRRGELTAGAPTAAAQTAEWWYRTEVAQATDPLTGYTVLLRVQWWVSTYICNAGRSGLSLSIVEGAPGADGIVQDIADVQVNTQEWVELARRNIFWVPEMNDYFDGQTAHCAQKLYDHCVAKWATVRASKLSEDSRALAQELTWALSA